MTRRTLCTLFVAAATGALAASVAAAPLNGQVRDFAQPDGTAVKFRVFGDEYYARLETLDGYTVVKDPRSGYFSYAELSPDGRSLISTGRAVGTAQPARGLREHVFEFFGSPPKIPPLPTQRGVRLSPEIVRRLSEESRAQLEEGVPPAASSELEEFAAPAPPRMPPPGGGPERIRGLLMLVQFSDVAPDIAREEIERYANDQGYSGFGNAGSVHDYFHDISNGRLDYSLVVTEFYTAKHPRSYYTDDEALYPTRAAELVREALEDLEANGFDFSSLSLDAQNHIRAINVFYAGPLVNEFKHGLWPHRGALGPPFRADRVTATRYQITSLGSRLELGTFCHENGHLLFDWPDLYDLGQESYGTGAYDIMSVTNDLNPLPPDPWLRHLEGWDDVRSLTGIEGGTTIEHVANSNSSFVYVNPRDPAEAFYVESRKRVGRNADFPFDGLVLWHVDAKGNNDYEQMLPNLHYMVSVEQHDDRFDLERNANAGDLADSFSGGHDAAFGLATLPDSRWWSGADSGLSIDRIGPPGDKVWFRLK